MNPFHSLIPRRAAGWLMGLLMLFVGLNAAAQQDPPGRVGRLNFQQGTVSVSPSGDDNWYQADPNRPLIAGDRVWADRNSRAEIYVGSTAIRLDEQTAITLSELDDQTLRITVTQGDMQMRVRDELAGQRIEVGTANLASVIDRPGDYRINADPGAGTTRVAVASGSLMLYGENGESMTLDAHQQLTVAGRNLAEANGAPPRSSGDFDRWVAERDRLDDQSVSARYVPRDMLGYQQLDTYGDWQSDPTYGQVWYPRGVDASWAPYQYGQWVDIAPWGWTWVDAAPWGFAPMHYGRWARIGPRWAWVPGRHQARPVYAPALVGFVGGGVAGANLAINGGRQGVGWFPLAPGEAWRPGYRASQRYIDAANRGAIGPRFPSTTIAFANRQLPGATTVVPVDAFGRGPVGRRDFIPVPHDRLVGVPAGMGAPIPLRERGAGGHGPDPRFGFGRQVAPPPAAIQAAQQHQFQQALQIQQAQRQQFEAQQRAGAQAAQAQAAQAQRMQQQAQQIQQAQRAQAEAQQRSAAEAMQAQRQQQEAQQRAAAQAVQAQQAQQLQQAQRQQEAQQRAAAQAQQAQLLQQAQRQQQEAQQRAAAQAIQAQQAQQAQQQMQMQRQQMEAQQRAAAQAMQAQRQQLEAQQLQRQQMEMQQRAAQTQALQAQQIQQQQQQQAAMRAQQQQAQQMLQAQQQQAIRQAQEARQRGMGRPGQDQGQPDKP